MLHTFITFLVPGDEMVDTEDVEAVEAVYANG